MGIGTNEIRRPLDVYSLQFMKTLEPSKGSNRERRDPEFVEKPASVLKRCACSIKMSFKWMVGVTPVRTIMSRSPSPERSRNKWIRSKQSSSD